MSPEMQEMTATCSAYEHMNAAEHMRGKSPNKVDNWRGSNDQTQYRRNIKDENNDDFANAVDKMSRAGYKGEYGHHEVPEEDKIKLDALYMQMLFFQ
ncbi:hypothetical protein OESDEN_03100 [Oesophagostomum dentatum]|uniref:Uncharacterized protein n=1 Tax=Oesophagostomum dentatum TaxID=61180 RepID=A0A0B1TLE7_OESDE|nr:hypothetical protein OESDEN_03100 [Oesophagostomum dentatum]